MKGLKNVGNTCYLNSGLQMLIQNRDLYDLIKKYSTKSQILNKICDFMDKYYDETTNSLIPIDIKKIVESRQRIFMGNNQHDSTEFIIYLLDIIDEEIKKIDKDSKGIEPLFNIKMNVRIKCKLRDCLQIYNRKEYNNFLLLDIETTSKSLEDVYRDYKSGVKLDLDNKYFCEKCNDKRIASKRNTIDEWPKHLYIWLKRFKQDGKKITKNNQDLEIPIEWRHNYKLNGAVIHSGGLNGGHYIYVGFNGGKWYLFNDSAVSEIKNETELKSLISKAYWLYYKLN